MIALELQAHGHTFDIDRPLSFEQDADDTAALLQQLHIQKADFIGFSNGGTTCLQMAIRHPGLIRKLVLVATLYSREGMPADFWRGMQQASLEHMPLPLQEAYLKANPDPAGLKAMFDRDVARMLTFKDIPLRDIESIAAPVLIINGDKEIVRVEHVLSLSQILHDARLAILPGDHGEYIREICARDKQSKNTHPGSRNDRRVSPGIGFSKIKDPLLWTALPKEMSSPFRAMLKSRIRIATLWVNNRYLSVRQK